MSSGARVRDVMTANPVCVEGSATVREVAHLFAENEISGAPVVGNGGRLIGVVSKTDLIRQALEQSRGSAPAYFFDDLRDDAGEDIEREPEEQVFVHDVMSEEPVTARPEEPVAAVAARMVESRVHRAVVVDEGLVPIGIVTSLDMLRALAGAGRAGARAAKAPPRGTR